MKVTFSKIGKFITDLCNMILTLPMLVSAIISEEEEDCFEARLVVNECDERYPKLRMCV